MCLHKNSTQALHLRLSGERAKGSTARLGAALPTMYGRRELHCYLEQTKQRKEWRRQDAHHQRAELATNSVHRL